MGRRTGWIAAALALLVAGGWQAGGVQTAAEAPVSGPAGAAADADDRAAVEAAVRKYCDAFYDVKPELLDECLLPELVKFGFPRSAMAAGEAGKSMSFSEARDLAGRANKAGRWPADAPRNVEVFEVLPRIAAAKLTAIWGVDYLHLEKVEGKWMIRHIIWQSTAGQ